MYLKSYLLILFAFAALPVFAQDALWVTANAGLRLRETPDPKGKVVATAPYSAKVVWLKSAQKTPSKTYTLDRVQGKFVRIKYMGKEGFAFDAFLQDEPPAPKNQPLYVVAASGLRFREKADANSTVLATIPFGDSLKTEGAVLSLWEIEEKTPSKVFLVENTKGYWQKSIYKGKTGYVFSGFVSHWQKPEVQTTSHVFLEEGYGCGTIVYNMTDYNWFGWYKKGNKTELKAVQKISYGMDEGDAYSTLITRTDRTAKGDTAMYIIGVRKGFAQPLAAGKVQGEWLGDIDYEEAEEKYRIDAKKPVFKFKNEDWHLKINALKINPDDAEGIDIKKGSFVLQSNDLQKKQTLMNYDDAKPYSETNDILNSFRIAWYGDLDGDGKLDFLVSRAMETYNFSLYLSTAAGKGQYVKKIGTIWGCGC